MRNIREVLNLVIAHSIKPIDNIIKDEVHGYRSKLHRRLWHRLEWLAVPIQAMLIDNDELLECNATAFGNWVFHERLLAEDATLIF